MKGDLVVNIASGILEARVAVNEALALQGPASAAASAARRHLIRIQSMARNLMVAA